MWLSILIGLANILPTPATPRSAAPVIELDCAHGPEAPLSARLSGPDRGALRGEVALVLEIERTRPDATPMNVEIEVPAGVKLLEAPGAPIVDPVSRTLSVVVRVAVVETPSDDLTVRVSARGQRHGAVASAAYRFGRESVRRAPLPRAEAITLKGHNGSALVARPVMLPTSAVSQRAE